MKLDLKQVEQLLLDKSTDFFKIYQHGKDYASYLIDMKLFELAQSGDIKALEKLEKRQADSK